MRDEKGFGLIELLISISIFGIFAGTLVGAFVLAREGVSTSGNRNRAAFLAEEGLEAVRNIRDDKYSSLLAGQYGLSKASGVWTLAGSSDATGIFTRTILIEAAPLLGKKVTSTVTWRQSPSKSSKVVLSMILTNWPADWTQPPAEGPGLGLQGGQQGKKIKVKDGYAYFVRESAGVNDINFVIVRVADTKLMKSLRLPGNQNNLYVEGDFAFVASSQNTELKVVNISNPEDAQDVIPGWNLPGNNQANGVYVEDNRAYVVRAFSNANNSPEFVIVDVSDPTNPGAPLGQIELTCSAPGGSDANEVVVFGNYAYVASSCNNHELQIFDISDSSNPVLLPACPDCDMPNENDAQTIAGFESGSNRFVFIGRGDGEMIVFDVANPLLPIAVGFTDPLPGNVGINDIDLGLQNTLAFAGTSWNDREVIVFDVSDPSNPVIFGGYNHPDNADVQGVDYDPKTGCLFTVTEEPHDNYLALCPD